MHADYTRIYADLVPGYPRPSACNLRKSALKRFLYMSITDPIADMLTRIRNASRAKKEKVDVPFSKLSQEVLSILKREKFVQDFQFIEDKRQGELRVYLKYTKSNQPAILGIKRVSRPGLRIYARKDKLPRVYGGLGIAILSTSRGIVTNAQAREMNAGGEVICYVW